MTSMPPPAVPSPARCRTRSFASFRTIAALILREMSTRYGRTPGGYFWMVAEPMAAILFLSVGFSLVMRSPSLGTSFLLFYATGYLPFNLYSTVSNNAARALGYSKPLLRYPAVTWIDAVLARFVLNALTGILTATLLLSVILAIVDSRAQIAMGPIVEATVLALGLGLGLGVMNCALTGLFPLWDVIWSILSRPVFLASAVLYIYEDLPPMAQDILWYNPLIHITGLMRSGFYPTYTAAYTSSAFVLTIAMILLAFGLVLMGRYHRVILNR